MSEKPTFGTRYKDWIEELSKRYKGSQIKAASSVNREMLMFYWSLGRDIVQMDAENVYGSGFYEKLSSDLSNSIPDSKGFAPRNIRYMKRLFQFNAKIYEIMPQVVAKLPQAITEPEENRQLITYVSAVDGLLKTENDQPTVGLLLCKTKDNVLAHYATNAVKVPVSISEYQISHLLNEDYRNTLPSIEALERELSHN